MTPLITHLFGGALRRAVRVSAPIASVSRRLLRRPVLGGWLAALVFLMGGAGSAVAQNGIFEGYTILSLNGGANQFYDLNNPTANPDLNGGNLGTFAAGSTNLVLKGAQLKTFKNGTDNVTGTRLRYRVYSYVATPGAFSVTPDLGFVTNESGTCSSPYSSCNQRWETNNLNINLLSGLSSGIYILEVYGESTNTGAGVLTLNNSGNNYRAQFTVGSSLINESFEGGLGSFTAVNNASTTSNRWQTGTLAGATAGANAAYISNSASSPFAYNYTGTNATVHLYQDVTIPAGQDLINLSFSWKGVGEATDYLRVSYAPTTFLPSATTTNTTSGTALTGTGTGTPVTLLNSLFNSASFVTATTTLPSSVAGTTIRLIFTWTNNSFTQNNGPAALDNVVLSSRTSQPLSGIYTIDNTQVLGNRTFPSFTRAAQALNEDGISAAVTFNVIQGQTFPEAPVRITATGTLANPISFVKTSGGTNPTLIGTTGVANTAGASGDAVIRLVGSDYITFDGINLSDAAGNVSGTTRMEAGLLLDGIFATSGCQNNTFKNGTITLNNASSNTPTAVMLRNAAGDAAGANSNNTFLNVTATNAAVGYSFISSAAWPDLNNRIDTESGGTSAITSMGGASLGPIQGVELTGQQNAQISNTTFRNFSGSATIYGIGATTVGSSFTASNNLFSNIVTSSSTLNVAAIFANASISGQTNVINGNQIQPISPDATSVSASVAGANVYGILVSSGSADIYNNLVNTVRQTATGTGGALVNGISVTGASSAVYNIYRNYLHTITQATTSGGSVSAIVVGTSVATANVYNNLVANVRYDANNGSPGVRALSIGGTASNVYYNTVRLTGTAAASATNFQSVALYISGGTVDYRNNILSNDYAFTAGGSTFRQVAVWFNAGAIAATTNNNLVYGRTALLCTSSASALQTTLAAYRTFLTGTRESAAVTESTTPFVSNTDPHLNSASLQVTQAESGGAIIALITNDYDNDFRGLSPGNVYPITPTPSNGGGTAPDIGADEGNFKPLDLTAPTITIGTPLVNTTSPTAPTLTNVTITDASGVNTTLGTRPRVYYKLSTENNAFAGNTSADNGWKFVEATGTTSPFSFNLDFSLLTTTPVGGNIIQYFVVAQDMASTPNVGINSPNGFAATPASVALTAAAAPITGTPLQYTILESFSGSINIGPGEVYNGQPLTTFTAVGGLFQRLNAGALTGNLTVLVTGDITTEDGTHVLNPPTESPASSNFSIRVQPSATTERLITGWVNGLTGVRGITLNGADRVTFDGRFNQTGTTKYLRLRSDVTSAGVFQLIQDATSNVVRDCYIESANGSSFSTGAVTFGTSSTTAVFNGVQGGVTGNDLNSVLNCDIAPTSGGSLAQGFYSAIPSPTSISNSECTVSGNNFINIATYGIATGSSTGSNWTISGNSFYQTVTGTGAQWVMNLSAATGSSGWLVSGNYIGGSAPLAGGSAWVNSSLAANTFRGIYLNGLGTSTSLAAVTVQNNVIGNISLTNAAATFRGIETRGSGDATSYALIGNTIENITSNSTAGGGGLTASPVVGILTLSTASSVTPGTAQLISGNVLRNLSNTGTGTGNIWIAGIQVGGSGLTNGLITRNRIYNITSSNATASAGGPEGIVLVTGDWNVTNNQVTFLAPSPTGANIRAYGIVDNVGATIRTVNVLFNSVVLAGTSSSGAQKTYAFARSASVGTVRNNIFLNLRTGGTGGNFAIGTSNLTTFVSNTNDLYVADPTKLGEVGSTAYTFANWQTTTSQDAASRNVNVKFVDTSVGNLNLDATTNCQLDNTGVAITGIDGEFDNAVTTRQTTPDIGSDEFSHTQQAAVLTTTGAQCAPVTGSVTINGTGNGPWSVVLSLNGTPQAAVSAAASPYTFATTAGNTYGLESVSDAYGPTATTGCALSVSGSPLTVNPLPTATLNAITAVCTGNTATLTGTLTGTGPWSFTYTIDGGAPQASGSIASSPFSISTPVLNLPGSPKSILITGISDANCTATAFPAAQTVVVNPRPTATLNAITAVCAGNSATLTGTLTGTGPWNFTYTIDGGATQASGSIATSPFSITTPVLNLPGSPKSILITGISDANCTATAFPAAQNVTVNNTTTWTGATNANWQDGSNWTNCVPTAFVDATIPNVVPAPVLSSGTGAVRDLTIQAGGSLTVSGGATGLQINGAFTNVGTFTSAVLTTFNGNAATLVPAGSYAAVTLVGTTNKTLTGAPTISGTLTMGAGSLELGNFDLTLTGTTGTVSGAGLTNYLVENGSGRLTIESVGTSGGRAVAFFPVGTSTTYNPAQIVNTGTTDAYSVQVTNVIPTGGPTPDPAGAHVVKKTWDVTEANTGGSNVTLKLIWNAALPMTGDEGVMFARNVSTISHFRGGAWVAGPLAAAVSEGGNQWSRTRSGLTSFSPFAVEDGARPLPVALTAFAAERKGADAQLTWTTATERNSRGFEVQVATQADGAFRTLGFVPSQNPTSTAPLRYTFLDTERGKADTRYYRLRMLDLEGTADVSPVKTVLFDGTKAEVTAVPNPFRTSLQVRVTAPAAGTATLTLTDALGRTVLTQTAPVAVGANTLTPHLPAALARGAYLLTTTVGGEVFRSRLVKE